MGDVRYVPYYETVRKAPRPLDAIRALHDDGVVAALAAASRANDPYLANVLATEAQNRMRRARTITASLGEGVYALDAEARTTFLNPAAERLLGWTRDELVGRPFHPHVHAGEGECAVLGVLRTGEPHVQVEDRFRAKDGRIITVDYTAAPIARDGEILGAVVVFRDAAERQRAEAAVRESEARLERIVETLAEGVVLTDSAGNIVLANAAAERILGLRRSAIVERKYDAPQWRSISLDGRALAPDELPIAIAMRTHEPVRAEHRLLRPDGDEIVLSVSASPLLSPHGQLQGVVASFDDVTARLAAQESALRLAAIVKSSVDGIIGKTLEGIITSWNKGAENLYGYAPHEAIGQHISFIVPPERLDELDGIMARVRSGRTTERLETQRVRKDGTRLEIEVTVSPVRDAEGRVVAAAAIQHDIRVRKRMEAELRESEHRYRSLFQAAGLGMVLTTPTGTFVEVNDAFAAMLGYAREELVGRTVADITHPEDLDQGAALMRELHAGRIRDFQMEKRYLRKDGSAVRGRVTVSVFREASGEVQYTIGLIEDLDEREIPRALARSRATE